MKYLGGLAKNRKLTVTSFDKVHQIIRLDKLPQSLPKEAFPENQLNLNKPITVWAITRVVEISQLKEKRNIAIVMNAETFSNATDIDYFITNISLSIVTLQWIVDTYSQRSWVEFFYP